jgi:hypothetical protein
MFFFFNIFILFLEEEEEDGNYYIKIFNNLYLSLSITIKINTLNSLICLKFIYLHFIFKIKC